MLPEIKTLLILQDRDHKRRRLRQDLQRLPDDAARAKSRLAAGEAALLTAKSTAADNEVAMKKLQLDIETRRTTISRLKTQQFETRKNDEYKAIEHEIERYSAEIAGLEDQELALMEKAEVFKKQVQAAAEALASTRRDVEADLGQMKTRHVTITAQLTDVDRERGEVASGLDAQLVQRYDRIFEKKAPAVVPLDHGICGGCHMKVTPTTLTQVKGEKGLAFCENCGRLLYAGE